MVDIGNNKFSVKLNELLVKYNFTQSQLAIKMYQTPSKMNQYVRGKRNPTRRSINEIAEALHCTREEHDDLLMAAGFLPESDNLDIFERVDIALRGELSTQAIDELKDFIRELKSKNERSDSEEGKRKS